MNSFFFQYIAEYQLVFISINKYNSNEHLNYFLKGHFLYSVARQKVTVSSLSQVAKLYC
jgi:hypothetical protein